MSLNYSSFVYVDDEAGNATEYMTIHADENRVWASLSDIPAYMKTAQVCIEDHRFCEHSGVDWRTTLNAVLKLFSGGSGGGSTMTQQLIKNITEDKDYSILRKVREIFTALNLEKKYSKQQILEAYLNVVNYGGQNNGVFLILSADELKDIPLSEEAESLGTLAKAQASGDLLTLADRGRRCVHLHLPDNSGVTLRALSEVITGILATLD